ncbi:MAG: PucR family transcriptional regulator, partial [Actinomycetia bacterium]|nr:PucR family transcriptional regulator [Actinomycetes bacterium]
MSAIAGGQVWPTLRQLLLVVGDQLSDLHVPEGHLDATLTRVSILDPDDEANDVAAALVLAVGARGRQAARQVRAAAAQGASAVAVKLDTPSPPSELLDAAHEGGVALLGVQPQMRWEQLAALVQEVRAGIESADAAHDDLPVTGLFALAETVAELTHGSVTIEDPVARVLAYSRSSEEADELRRQTILGLQGPEPYLALLREWGVYRKIRAGDEVVEIEERPELGIRSRLVVGIGSGQANLGTIWVAEGSVPLADEATDTLRGAARVAEEYLIGARPSVSPRTRDQRALLARTLDGSARPDLVADRLGIDLSAGCVVVAVAVASQRTPTAELIERVAIGASAYWPSANVSSIGTRVYILLADAESGRAPARAAAAGVVTTLSRGRGTSAVAGVGAHVPVSSMVASRAEADRVASALGR